MGIGIYSKLTKKAYSYKNYWGGKGGDDHYNTRKESADDSTVIQMNFLKDYLHKFNFKSVYEIACGYGRFTKLISENFKVDDYVAVDINKSQIKHAKELCDPKIQFLVTPIEDHKIDKKFDLVFGAEILLHIKPEDIQNIINKLVSLSKKQIIIMDMGIDYQHLLKDQKISPNVRCFQHDLAYLFLKNPKVESVTQINASEKSSLYDVKLKKEYEI